MKRFILPLITLLSLASLQSAEAAERVGAQRLDVSVPSRAAPLAVTIWYPAGVGGERALIGDDRLFKGTEAWRDAPPAEGRRPLILLSHGSGGAVETMGWIARQLAEAGYIVAGPNHPGTTRGDSTPLQTTEIWRRPTDVSELLTALLERPDWKDRIDADRIGAFGFSLGGYTVMALAGVQVELEAYGRYCDANRRAADCVWFASAGVDVRRTDRARFERSNLDRRISMAFVVDPAITRAMTVESLKGVAISTHIVNLGDGGQIPLSVRGDDVAARIQGARYDLVSGAAHLSFLAECQAGAVTFLKSVGESDPLCDDAEGAPKSRARIHEEIAAIALAAFQRDFSR